jgi:hypothetical protein
MNGVYFREFPDGAFEIGILEDDWMHSHQPTHLEKM